MSVMLVVAYIVLGLSFLNLLRMAIFMIGGDIFDIKKSIKERKSRHTSSSKYRYSPLVTVLVPAHNEELVLRRNLESVAKSTYKNIQLIIINDSSTDKTQAIAKSFQRKYKDRFKGLKVLRVNVRGKAPALNAGLQYTKGSLFMCLDADSAVRPDAVANAVAHFSTDKQLACISSNVKIFNSKGVLEQFQQLEYLVCYQMKKAETISSTQYIVGGIGSMFRTRLIRSIDGYDTDTITEDIDLSMRLLSSFGDRYRIGYYPDVVTYTEPVHDIVGLLRQRFRWKYGRYQAFAKYKDLFFPKISSHHKLLGWLTLPYALLSELLYAIEPLVVAFIFYTVLTYSDLTMLAGSFIVFVFYTTIHITGATQAYSLKERMKFIAKAPLAYVGMYILSFVEYVATIRGFMNLKKISVERKNGVGGSAWTHVERRGDATVI